MTEEKIDNTMENKFIILKIDCEEYNVEVIGVFEEERDAIQYLQLEIQTDENIKDPDWYKKLLDENSISVYKLGYIFKKTLIYRYFIKHY